MPKNVLRRIVVVPALEVRVDHLFIVIYLALKRFWIKFISNINVYTYNITKYAHGFERV